MSKIKLTQQELDAIAQVISQRMSGFSGAFDLYVLGSGFDLDGWSDDMYTVAEGMYDSVCEYAGIQCLYPDAIEYVEDSIEIVEEAGKEEQELDSFYSYVDSFYGEGGVYGEQFNLRRGTYDLILPSVCEDYIIYAKANDNWGNGDTFDREAVRDILIYRILGHRYAEIEWGYKVAEFNGFKFGGDV